MNIPVILTEKITHLGALGEQVSVKPGYARNYLLPKGKAIRANAENIAKFETQRAELEKAAAQLLAAAQKRASTLEGVRVEISAKASEEGKLFGSITVRDIEQALKAKGVEVEKKEIIISAPVRTLGEYEVFVQFHPDVRTPLVLSIISSK